MPTNSDAFYQESDHGLTITARTLSGSGRRTLVSLAGEIDMEASTILSKTADWLAERAPVSVLVDLAELTFAGATLLNFVVRVRQVLPDGADLILWRARPATELVLRVTDMATIATIRDERTEQSSWRAASTPNGLRRERILIGDGAHRAAQHS